METSVEQTQAQSDERYALAMDSINEGIYDWSIGSGDLYFSPRLRDMMGPSAGEVTTPEEWLSRIHPDDLPSYRHALVAHFKGDTPRFEAEYRYRSDDRTWRWARQHGIAIRGPDGRACRMVGATGDITETKRREVELQASRAETERTRELLQIVLDSMTDGIALIEADGRWVVMNRALFHINGLPAEVAKLRFMRDIFCWQVETGHVPRRCATIDEDVALLEKWFVEADAKPVVRRRPNGRWVESRCLPLADRRRLVMHRDITELKEQEERIASERDAADAANRAKSTFLATMSHEIRTPMNGVLGMIEVLERQAINDVQGRTVSIMRDSAQALLRIIDDVLDFSKIESGHLELESTVFSLSGLIEGALDTVRPQAAAKGLVLEATVDPGSDDALVGDPTRVRAEQRGEVYRAGGGAGVCEHHAIWRGTNARDDRRKRHGHRA